MQIETRRNYAHHNIKGKLVSVSNNRNIYLLLMNVGCFIENTWEYPRETCSLYQDIFKNVHRSIICNDQSCKQPVLLYFPSRTEVRAFRRKNKQESWKEKSEVFRPQLSRVTALSTGPEFGLRGEGGRSLRDRRRQQHLEAGESTKKDPMVAHRICSVTKTQVESGWSEAH